MLSTTRYLRQVDIERAQPILYPYGRPSKIWTKGFTMSWDTMNRIYHRVSSIVCQLPEIRPEFIGRACWLINMHPSLAGLNVQAATGDLIADSSGSRERLYYLAGFQTATYLATDNHLWHQMVT